MRYLILLLLFLAACAGPSSVPIPTPSADLAALQEAMRYPAVPDGGVAFARIGSRPEFPPLPLGWESFGRWTPHPRGWGTDPHMLRDREGGWHCWWNHPGGPGIGTRIAYAHSVGNNVLEWTAPKIVLTKADVKPAAWGSGGVETPSCIENRGNRPDLGRWVLAVLTKQFDSNRDRFDRVMLFHGPKPSGPFRKAPVEALVPIHPWEGQWRGGPQHRNPGKLRGGLQEPSLQWLGGVLVMAYSAMNWSPPYGGPKSSIAWLLPGRRDWARFEAPLLPVLSQIDLEFRDGGAVVIGSANTNSRIEMTSSWDLVNWRPRHVLMRNPVIPSRQLPNGDETPAIDLVGPSLEGRHLMMLRRNRAGTNQFEVLRR